MLMRAIYVKLQRFFEMAIGYAVKHRRYWNGKLEGIHKKSVIFVARSAHFGSKGFAV